MKKTFRKAILLAGATLLFFVLLALVIDLATPIAGRPRLALWVGLVVLGLTGAALLYLLLAPKLPRRRGRSDVEVLLDASARRLAARGKISNLPVALLLGPSGSAKTTSVLEAGIGAELIAGETGRPTTAVNVWYAGGNVLVEAGGGLPDDAARWGRLLKRLRPGRLAAALGRGRQAPRVAIVCVPCDAIVAAGSSTAIPELATRLRNQVAEVARELGVRLPVYVVFTKLDRLPHFEAFARGMTRDEAQELLGATLPIQEVAPGQYADFQAARVQGAFEGIFRSLAEWRLRLMPREGREVDRSSAYEFPREMRKIADLTAAFLVELTRPSQLGINPFLRGFYFTGVRPIVVNDSPLAAPAPPDPQQRVALGATSVFNPGAGAQEIVPQAAGAARRAPEWTFLKGIFPAVVMADERAQALTAGGSRVDLLRRAGVAAAGIAMLVLSVGFTVSFVNNRALLAESRQAMQGVRQLTPAVGEAPDAESLIALDSLRGAIDRLSSHERGRPPLRLRWGLYAGDEARIPLRELYFSRFATLLWNDTRTDLANGLRTLPAEPAQTEDYARAYGALKAYLVTTSHPHESRADFLTPALLQSWRYGDDLDDGQRELVSRQFDFFARELPLGNPFPAEPAEAVVVRGREYLAKFRGEETAYRALLGEGARVSEPVDFTARVPEAEGVMSNPYVVPGEFTDLAWARVQEILGDLDSFLSREEWVVGERARISPQERAQLEAKLRVRYVNDYAGAWRRFLEAGSVAGLGAPQAAARKLNLLASNQSPLMRMFALAAQHTAVDTTQLRNVFQPVYSIMPAGRNESYINEANQPYMQGLLGVQAAMASVAAAPAAEQTALAGMVSSNATQVTTQVNQLAQGFATEGEAARVGNAVKRLLASVPEYAASSVGGLGAANINVAASRVCTTFNSLNNRYPFATNPNARNVTIDELTAALQPGGSLLWSFHEQYMQGLVVKQGNGYAAQLGAEPRPTPGYVGFFNRAATLSEALFPDGAQSPVVRFTLQFFTTEAIPEVTVTVDGRSQTFTRTVMAGGAFTWDGARARSFRVSAKVNGIDRVVLEGNEGPWTLVRLLRTANWQTSSNGRYTLRFPISGEAGELVATFAAGTPLFAPNGVRLSCSTPVVR